MSADLHLYALPAHLKNDFMSMRAVSDVWQVTRDQLSAEGIDVSLRSQWPQETIDRFREVMAQNESAYKELERKVRPWGQEGIWLGQVSYMKAGLSEDVDRYIPQAIQRVHTIMDGADLHVMTPALRANLTTAFNVKDVSIYAKKRTYYGPNAGEEPTGKWYDRSKRNQAGIWFGTGPRGIAKRQHIRKFCDAHMGEFVYIESE